MKKLDIGLIIFHQPTHGSLILEVTEDIRPSEGEEYYTVELEFDALEKWVKECREEIDNKRDK